MVAPVKNRRVVCNIVRVAERPSATSPRLGQRPSTLIPWADPYIAGLVERLQDEVRRERSGFLPESKNRSRSGGDSMDDFSILSARGAYSPAAGSMVADLEPPSPAADPDWEWWERPQWSIEAEPTE